MVKVTHFMLLVESDLSQREGKMYHQTRYPLAFAHRLGGALAPENTLAGLLLARRLGLRAAECDVQLSRDGVAIIAHDALLSRTSNGEGPLAAHTAAQLAQLDAGSHHHAAFAGETMPTLAALAAAARLAGMQLNLELKPAADAFAMGQACARQISQLWQGDRHLPLVSSFDVAALEGVRQQAPALPLALLVDSVSAAALERARALGCYALHVDYRSLSADWVLRLHEAGLAVMAWTVNQREDMQRLRQWGVDMLCSDRPDRFDEAWLD